MSVLPILAYNLLALFIWSIIGYVISVFRKRADVADMFWGLGFILVGWLSYLLTENSTYHGIIVNILVTLWGVRLFLHIYYRHKSEEEDFRYQRMKEKWNTFFYIHLYAKVFLLQSLILFVVALPIMWLQLVSGEPKPFLFQIGILFWFIGFIYETIADYQLLIHKRQGKKELLTSGLWSESRHPNYFGEIVIWWAIFVMAASLMHGFALAISPLLITWLIIRVSGIAPVEKRWEDKEGFETYKQKTPMLIPNWFLNGFLFFIGGSLTVYCGIDEQYFLMWLFYVVTCLVLVFTFYKRDQKSFAVFFPLFKMSFATGLAIYLIAFATPFHDYFPFYMIMLYTLLSLVLNSTLASVNKHWIVSLVFSWALSLFTCFALINTHESYTPYILSIFYGLWLFFLFVYNKTLIRIYNHFTNKEFLDTELTVYFDDQCPICSKEMNGLKNKEHVGKIIYEPIESEDSLIKRTQSFTFKQAMQKIHAEDENGKVYKGIDALAMVYAKTNLLFLAIFLEAPFYHFFMRGIYAVWAKLRPKSTKK